MPELATLTDAPYPELVCTDSRHIHPDPAPGFISRAFCHGCGTWSPAVRGPEAREGDSE